MAVRVLSMVSSSGACERNWSAFLFEHSKKRNRLANERAVARVYLFTIRRRFERATKSESFAEWTKGEEDEEWISI